jgi:hypothetical protein
MMGRGMNGLCVVIGSFFEEFEFSPLFLVGRDE